MTTFYIDQTKMAVLIHPDGTTKPCRPPQATFTDAKIFETGPDAQMLRAAQLRNQGHEIFVFRGSDNVIAIGKDAIFSEEP